MYFLSVNRIKPDLDRARFNDVIARHREWVKQEIAAGRIVQAGKWGERGGMLVFKAQSKAEAEAMADQDPLLVSGMIDQETDELHPAVPFR